MDDQAWWLMVGFIVVSWFAASPIAPSVARYMAVSEARRNDAEALVVIVIMALYWLAVFAIR